MKKIKLSTMDIRKAIDELGDQELSAEIADMHSEEFLDSNLREDFGLDSLEIAEITMVIEREHHVSIPDKAYGNFNKNGGTVRAMLDEYNRILGF